MKKVILMAVFAFATLSASASSTDLNTATIKVATQETYKEVALTDVAKPVLDAIVKDYEGAVLRQAFINEENEYKLELTIGEVAKTVFADAQGNWITK